MKTNYQSKLFRVGNILLALALAIRGIPRTWQLEEDPVTRESGWAIYAPEIEILDRINPRLHIFHSGVLAAALMTVALDPAMVAFWERLNQERWVRHKDGRIDPVGWLIHEILRHSCNREIAVRPDYQHYLFQTALAAARAWQESQQSEQPAWLKSAPPRVDIGRLLEQVRQEKGIRRSLDGFRPAHVLQGRIPALAGTEIEHVLDWPQAELLASKASKIAEYACDTTSLATARTRLGSMDIPSELAAPGALAAALVSIARDPDCDEIWNDVFAGRWSHDPDQGSDVAGQIVRTIEMHNRQCAGIESQAELFARIQMAIKSHVRRSRTEADPRARNLPRARLSFVQQLIKAWSELPIPHGPVIHTGQVRPLIKGDPANHARPPCQKRRGKARDKTGRLGEMIFERLHEQCSLPRAGKLIDRTREQCGFDHELRTRGQPAWYFEVKVVKNGEISLTEKQWETAQLKGDRYWLVLVRFKSEGGSEVSFIRNPATVLKARKDSRVVIQTNYKVHARTWRRAAKGWIRQSLDHSEDETDVDNT